MNLFNNYPSITGIRHREEMHREQKSVSKDPTKLN